MQHRSDNSHDMVVPSQALDGHQFSRYQRLVTAVVWVAGVMLAFSPLSSHAAFESHSGPKGSIVAAGFGYQSGADSVITVKVYDAQTGEILSDDVYELSVKEDSNLSASNRDRIFAGGVGGGATDLSNFVLRVYDARTGLFQWQGQLNLSPTDGLKGGKLVGTTVPRRAIITRVHGSEKTLLQPMFMLTASDTLTGTMLWHDEFFAMDTKQQRVPTATKPATSDGQVSGSTPIVDFRIRMYDLRGQDVMWEDQLFQHEAEEDVKETPHDQATTLPAWPKQSAGEPAPEEI